MIATTFVATITTTIIIFIMCLCLTTPTTVATGTTLSVNNNAVDISSTSPTSGEVSTAINARVAERTLRINIPNGLMQHNSITMESLFTAVLDPLGGDRCRILSSSKQRQNSHNIVVTLDGDSLVWTWPELLWNYIGCSWKWVPAQGPSPEGVSSKHIQLQQFCDIANRGALVSATADNKLQLRFQLNVVQTTSSPSEIIECAVSKSSLSPNAPVFEYSTGVIDFNPPKFILSSSAESFTPPRADDNTSRTSLCSD